MILQQKNNMINLYKIKDIGNFFGGLTGKSKEDFNIGNAKFVSYMTVFSNPQLPDSINDTVLISENEKQNKIKKGDILFTGSSETPDECGMSCVVTQDIDEDIYLNSFCFGLRLNNKEIANPAYLSHYFRSNYARKQIKKTANGVTRFNISKKKFSEIEIVIPPIKVQEEIVKILDSFTNLIDALNEELSLRQKQFEYYREKLLTFDDNVYPMSLGDCCVIKGRIGFRGYTIKDQVNKGEGAISLSPGNISEGIINYNQCTYISWDKYYESPEIMINNGDIIFCKTGSTVGKVTVVEKLPCEATINPQLVVLKEININKKYLYYYLSSNSIQNKVKSLAGVGSVPNISQSILNDLNISVPSSQVMKSIVSKLDAFESLISSLKEEIALRQKQYEYYREKLLTFD